MSLLNPRSSSHIIGAVTVAALCVASLSWSRGAFIILDPHSWMVAGRSAVCGTGRCGVWEKQVDIQRGLQRDYCTQRFTGEPPRQDVIKAKYNGPVGSYDFFVINEYDKVSNWVDHYGSWERAVSQSLIDALKAAATHFKATNAQDVYMLDVGANIGVHTAYVAAAGFSVLAFEPLELNEEVIRSTLCVVDPDHNRVTLFTKGLSNESALCVAYSDEFNMGDGHTYCGPPDAFEVPEDYTVRGKVEVVRLDELWRCDGGCVPQRIGVMKVDVEGHELQVFAGAWDVITRARIPFLVFEIEQMDKVELQKLTARFRSLGYRMSTSGFFTDMSSVYDVTGGPNLYLSLLE